jgi:hypothetical protein
MFNNYNLTLNSKWTIIQKRIYEKQFIKQGFTNYESHYSKRNIDNENAIDGNFYQTENEYTFFSLIELSTDTTAWLEKEMLTLLISLIKILLKHDKK